MSKTSPTFITQLDIIVRLEHGHEAYKLPLQRWHFETLSAVQRIFRLAGQHWELCPGDQHFFYRPTPVVVCMLNRQQMIDLASLPGLLSIEFAPFGVRMASAKQSRVLDLRG